MPLECPEKIVISGAEERTVDKKAYTVYIVQCQNATGSSWVCEKRYSEFENLRKALIKDKCDKIKKLDALADGEGKFPKKKWGGGMTPEVVALRKTALERWLLCALQFYPENLNLQSFFVKVAAVSAKPSMASVAPAAAAAPEPAAETESMYEAPPPPPVPDEFQFSEPAPMPVEEVGSATEYVLGKPRFGSVNAVVRGALHDDHYSADRARKCAAATLPPPPFPRNADRALS